jgi:4-hydroxybenzoate polyprenyltransferase
MYDTGLFVRFTRINDYIHILFLIFPLIFLISPTYLFSYKTMIVFFANLFLTAFGYMFNDVEDAEDDYHDIEKRKRNLISSGEITRRQSYFFSFLLLSVGVLSLLMVNSSVFILGIIFALVGFLYSWKPLRLKSKPYLDLISHMIFLGVLQFLITYLAFRPLDLFVIPFLMIVIPFSMMNEIIHELKDYDVDESTNIKNTVQKFERSDIKKGLIILASIAIVGFSIIILTMPQENRLINVSMSLLLGIAALFRLNARASIITQAK